MCLSNTKINLEANGPIETRINGRYGHVCLDEKCRNQMILGDVDICITKIAANFSAIKDFGLTEGFQRCFTK